MMLALCVLLAVGQSADFDFRHTYVAGTVADYALTGDMMGMKLRGEIETSVKSVSGDGAVVEYKALKLDMGMPMDGGLPDLVTPVTGAGAPEKATIRSAEEFFVFLGVAGIAPCSKVHVGDSVDVAWKNQPGDVSFKGSGKIVSCDAGLMKVHWDLTMTPSYTTGGEFVADSVYRVKDFSLESTEIAQTVGGATIKFGYARRS